MRQISRLRKVLAASALLCIVATSSVAQTRAEREAANDLLDEGYRQFQAGNMSEAQSNFDMALEIDPNNSIAHFHAADIYQATGQIRKMKLSWEKAAKLGKGTAHGIRAKLKLKRWNDTHNNTEQRGKIDRILASFVSGSWCRKENSYLTSEDQNGRLWHSETRKIFLTGMRKSDNEVYWSLEELNFLINPSCVIKNQYCKHPKSNTYISNFQIDCKNGNCFDYQVINDVNKSLPIIRFSYGENDKMIDIVVKKLDEMGNFENIDISIGHSRHGRLHNMSNTGEIYSIYNAYRCRIN